jgi:hypothetical protein
LACPPVTSSSRQALQVQEAAARFNPQRKFTGLDPKQVRHVANQFKGEQQPERKCTGIDPQQVGVCAALCSLTRIFSRVLNETQVRKAASQFTNQDKKERRLTGLDPAKVGPAWLSGTVHRSSTQQRAHCAASLPSRRSARWRRGSTQTGTRRAPWRSESSRV